MFSSDGERITHPSINVTPLIDVLLVLLIIFMVSAPLKPARFAARVPDVPDQVPIHVAHPWTLVVTIEPDHTLRLNSLTDMGTVDDTSKLSETLANLFEERKQYQSYGFDMLAREDLSPEERIERTVYIKAPVSIRYGEVAKVIDGVKGAGASPIGLQLDNLD